MDKEKISERDLWKSSTVIDEGAGVTHEIVAEGKKCALAKMQEAYLIPHVNYLNNPEINQYIFSQGPFTVEQQKIWLKEKENRGDEVYAILTLTQKNEKGTRLKFIGVMELNNINRKNQTAYTASFIGDKSCWGRGIATEARLIILKRAFEDLKLKWVYSKTIASNIRSQRSLEHSGYRQIKVINKSRKANGELHDEFVYRISRTLWLKKWKEYKRRNTPKGTLRVLL